MTKLIVDPIDPSKPGSYKARRQFMALAKYLDALRSDGAASDWRSVAEVFEAMEALILPRLSTDDGTPVEEALDAISARQFDELLSGITFGAEVPPESASSSSSPSEVREALPTG